MYIALLYIYCSITNFACHLQMSKHMYEKPRHSFIQKLHSLNFKDSIK